KKEGGGEGERWGRRSEGIKRGGGQGGEGGEGGGAEAGVGGCRKTPVGRILGRRGKRHMGLAGIATNVCVESTLRDGFFLEYFGVVLEDATHQAGPEFAQKAALFNIETFFGGARAAERFGEAFSPPPLPVSPKGVNDSQTRIYSPWPKPPRGPPLPPPPGGGGGFSPR
ncbi:isochorismatase family protein, partial [Escherichia coli]|nr:isochorismatase family protein [Escherichia coli]